MVAHKSQCQIYPGFEASLCRICGQWRKVGRWRLGEIRSQAFGFQDIFAVVRARDAQVFALQSHGAKRR
ncbi:hypothetical protein GCM10010873_16950 [Cypionkella aquatica]|uniref:Uncharacterized protein n=1 Tax=Cypionkella aquatica TaxID=1756042 RepID=A0AA37TZ42_9RHOB|nr:hypothetical protein GCM10010873_01220 [Cypionkella aquatica]GLS86721.1 hypothetical protein GCM10010873_16950 [Cypionkella aquatica]